MTDQAVWWLRWWYRTPLVERWAHAAMWWRGCWDVVPADRCDVPVGAGRQERMDRGHPPSMPQTTATPYRVALMPGEQGFLFNRADPDWSWPPEDD